MSDNKPTVQAKTQHGHSHKEAFCIMTYRCKDCGHEERIWNSRDGVTPFCIGCPKCKGHNHYHVDWYMDRYAPCHTVMLKPGDRYFITMTMERARGYAVINVDRQIELGHLPASRRNEVIKLAAASYFNEGNAPDIATKV